VVNLGSNSLMMNPFWFWLCQFRNYDLGNKLFDKKTFL